MPLGSAAAAATIAAAMSINPLAAVSAADSGAGTTSNNVQCSINSSNNSSTDNASKTGDVFGTAQAQPTAEQLQRAGEILDQARTLLAAIPQTGGDGITTALRARLQAHGIAPVLGTGVAQAARDASDALLTVPGARPASIATALARAGYGPTPADVVPRVVTAVTTPEQRASGTMISGVYTPAAATAAGPPSALASLVNQQPAIQRQMLTAADNGGSQADCLAWLSKVQKLVEQALADPSDPAAARVLQELQNSDGADLLGQENGQGDGGTTAPSTRTGDTTSSPRGEEAGRTSEGTGSNGSSSTSSGSTGSGASDSNGSSSTGDGSTGQAEGDWQAATQDLLSKLDAAAPDDPTAGEWAEDIRGVIGQEGRSATGSSGTGQGGNTGNGSTDDSSTDRSDSSPSGDAHDQGGGNNQDQGDDHSHGHQDDQDSSKKPEEPAAASPVDAAGPAAAPASRTWEALANCESSGKWDTNTGNGYHGGLQFDNATWSAYGGTRYAPSADKATKEQQIEIAEKVRQDRGGFGAWPACSSKLGLGK